MLFLLYSIRQISLGTFFFCLLYIFQQDSKNDDFNLSCHEWHLNYLAEANSFPMGVSVPPEQRIHEGRRVAIY